MRLAVNIDHFATLRNARKEREPDPVVAACLAEMAGASGIVCHLREDRRHIQDEDVLNMRKLIKTKLDLEMAATHEMKNIALSIRPDVVTLVPENREELTTEGGLNLGANEHLGAFISDLKRSGILVSVFIEPERRTIELASELKCDFVELHTGTYSRVPIHSELQSIELRKIQDAASFARRKHLRVVAGHGLNYYNVYPLRLIEEIEEVSIGHAIVARASLVGLTQAVSNMVQLIQ